MHGDYQPGNWLAVDERVLACDFATACQGPAWWDLTLFASRCGPGRRYPNVAFELLCAGYGERPPRDSRRWLLLTTLWAVSTAVAVLSRDVTGGSIAQARRALARSHDVISVEG